MKTQTRFTIGLVKPTKAVVRTQSIKATDWAWRTAIFGLGGTRKRIGGAKIGGVDGQPLAVIAELPEEVDHDGPCWTIETDAGLWAFIGPAAVYNDVGYGPATLGIDLERLKSIITFNPEPKAMAEGLARTLESRNPPDAGKQIDGGPVCRLSPGSQGQDISKLRH